MNCDYCDQLQKILDHQIECRKEAEASESKLRQENKKLKQQNEKLAELLDEMFFYGKPISEQKYDSLVFRAKELLKQVKGE